MIDLDAIKARLAAPYAAGAYDITVRLADGRLCATVRMRDWDGNTAHDADAAVTRLLSNAPADLTVLVAEVERLRGEADRERAAVVTWLRACEDESCVFSDDIAFQFAAEIERGEHVKGGK